MRQLDRRIAKAANDIQMALSASGTTLTELHGLGALTAGKILGRIGDVRRFRSAAAFASYTGTAPIEVSSGEVVRHRLSRAGERQLNFCLHVMALAQVRHDTPGRAYYLRKRSEGKKSQRSHALLETPPVRHRVPTTGRRRSQPEGGPGRTLGGGSIVSRGQLTPRTPALQTSHFPSPPPNPTTRQKPTT